MALAACPLVESFAMTVKCLVTEFYLLYKR